MPLLDAIGAHHGTRRQKEHAVHSTLHQQLGEQLALYTAMVKKAQAVIDQMHTERYKTLLTERYINLCSWPEVTRRIGYRDEKSVFRAVRYAMNEAAAGCIPPL